MIQINMIAIIKFRKPSLCLCYTSESE